MSTYLLLYMQIHHHEDDLKLTGSEQLTLAARGYKMLKKVNEGSYAKVFSDAKISYDKS